jgi:hypothetical protein
MNAKKGMIILLTLVMLLVSLPGTYSAAVSKIDGFNDVYYQVEKGNQTKTYANQVRPDVDIYKVLYIVNKDDGEVQVSIALNGSIVNSDSIHYVAWYNTTNASYYLHYTNGVNIGWATDLGSMHLEKYSEIEPLQTTNHTIMVTYGIIGSNTTTVDLWGYASEKSIDGSETHLWIDYVPNSRASFQIEPDNGSTGDNGDATTPGFEAYIVFITSIVIAYFIRRKK